MLIDRVTMTGPDDSIDPARLLEVSQRYPFVEWGLLASKMQAGSRRYPSHDWLRKMRDIYGSAMFSSDPAKSALMNLSCHVCGRWVRFILKGQGDFFTDMAEFLPMFNRIQINTHAEQLEKHVPGFTDLLATNHDKQFILQWEGVNGEELLTAALFRGLNAVPLFDMSHGAGVSPDEWPKRLCAQFGRGVPLYCGYAGGLGPENLESELKRIEQTVNSDGEPSIPIWIDMETRIRSNNDEQFDIHKVIACLEIAKPYVRTK